MHSSRMHTACFLTISQHALRRGVFAQGVCLPRGDVCGGGVWQSPPVNRMTDRFKNITLPVINRENMETITDNFQ